MSFLSAQGSNAIFKNTIVNDLTINGKLIIAQDASGSAVQEDLEIDTISSYDGTNKIDLSTPNEIKYESTTNSFFGDIVLNGHNLNDTGHISGENGIVEIASGNQLHLFGSANINNCKVQGSYIDWNDGNGDGKMNLITNRGSGHGGFAFYNVHSDSAGNVDQTTTNEIVNIDATGALTIYSVTDSTSASTGALIVDGGIGIEKQAHIGGIATILNTTDSTSLTTGALIVNGGVGVAKNANVGGIATILNTTDSTSLTTGALIVNGGVGVAKNVHIGGITTIANTTDSTSLTTGALIIDGGLAVNKNSNLEALVVQTTSTLEGIATCKILLILLVLLRDH